METERLIIDPVRKTDKEDFFHSISRDRNVLETFLRRHEVTLEDFDFSSFPANKNLFAIRLKATGRRIGVLLCSDGNEDSCEIGYGIGPAYWNRGYATEAVKRLIEYCFCEKGFQTVFASFLPGNDASKRVMEKCGMALTRFPEKEWTYPGAERDLTYYSIRGKPEVLLLNGPSSAGKSSIAGELRTGLSRDGIPAVIISLDDYLRMSVEEPIWEEDVFEVTARMYQDVAGALREGKTVIVDHVITSARIYDGLMAAIAGFKRKTVLVKCAVEILRQREADRGDRFAGSAEASLQYLYPPEGYDLCVDSGETDPASLAGRIRRYAPSV